MEKSKIQQVLDAFRKAVRKIYEEAAANGEKLPIADKNGKVVYLDPNTVLNK